MDHQGVLLVTVFEEDVQVLVEVQVQPRDLEGILEVSEIVIFIKCHGQETQSENCRSQEIGTCYMQLGIEIVETVIV